MLYDYLKAHSASNRVLVVSFVWGLAEGTFFFIVPDVYILLVAVLNWRRGMWAALSSVAGSMLGGALMYGLAGQDSATMVTLLTHIPLISPQLVESVALRMEMHGLATMVYGPLQGIPYKVYAVQAGTQSLPLLPFLFMTIPARLERLIPVALGGAVAGAALGRFIRCRTKLAMGVYALLWVGVYGVYSAQVG